MAQIVLGIGTSHSPMLSTPPEMWHLMGEEDTRSPALVDPETGEPIAYADLVRRHGDNLHPVDKALFHRQWQASQDAIEALSDAIREAKPDVLVIVSADQRELLFDENMPMLQIYWGDTVAMVPRYIPDDASDVTREWNWGYGDFDLDLPVDAELGRHLIEYMTRNDVDIAQSRYLRSDLLYGGSVGPAGYMKSKNVVPPKRQGIGHGWSFIIKRLLHNNPIPIVPVIQNGTFPPNMPTPRRCYAVGKVLREAIESWPSDKRVCVIASGGLSHFVTDEKIDRMLLDAIVDRRTEEVLPNLPEERLNSATAEIRSWITVAATCAGMTPTLVDYLPVYRSPGGTGGGWGFLLWR